MSVPARADEGIDAVVGGLGGGSKRQEGACEYYGAFGKAHGVQWGGKLRMLGAKLSGQDVRDSGMGRMGW